MTDTDPDDSGAAKRPRGRPRSSSSKAPGSVKGLDSGLIVLRALAAEEHPTLTNVALGARTSPSTAYRMLVTLQRHGFAEFDERTQEWAVGVEAFRMGTAFLARSGLVELARPVMLELMHDTHETANLAIADGNDVVFLAQVEARHPIRAFHEAGSRGHMHASGIGKALLAELRVDAVSTFVKTFGLASFTANTLVAADALEADLARVQQRGWSLDDEESYEGMRCVAAAIFDASGRAVAGVSISGPAARFPDTALDGMGQRVVAAALAIGERLGVNGADIASRSGST